LAGAVLSQNPWRSVDGYVGHSVGVQLLALVSLTMLAASTISGGGEPEDSTAEEGVSDEFGRRIGSTLA
jgi:arabinofuranan 3-O-arabinosyltransferase